MMARVGPGLGYLAAFGIGVTVAMTVFAMAAAGAVRAAAERSLMWGRRAAMLVGGAALATGAWWIVRAVLSANALSASATT
jgi:hypothetical protein